MRIEDHLRRCHMDINLLERLVDLYEISKEIDPNRVNTGIDIYRNFEYQYALDNLGMISSSHKVLDIGSSSTIWPVTLYAKYKCEVHATDIDIANLDSQYIYLNNIKKSGDLGTKFFVESQDATNLKYEDRTFDVVTSISAIEHIPGDGDIKAFNEFSRVLKPRGMYIFTAPFSSKFIENETEHYHFSYEKRYDFESIKTRFNNDDLKLKKLYFINGNSIHTDEISDFWYKYALYQQLGQVSMIYSLLMFNISENPSDMSRGVIGVYEKK